MLRSVARMLDRGPGRQRIRSGDGIPDLLNQDLGGDFHSLISMSMDVKQRAQTDCRSEPCE
jgi:hypothetical protein